MLSGPMNLKMEKYEECRKPDKETDICYQSEVLVFIVNFSLNNSTWYDIKREYFKQKLHLPELVIFTL